MLLRPAALLGEPDPREHNSKWRAALGRGPWLVYAGAYGDVFSGGHPAGWDRLLEVLRAVVIVPNPI
jgi:hypothetical protein